MVFNLQTMCNYTFSGEMELSLFMYYSAYVPIN